MEAHCCDRQCPPRCSLATRASLRCVVTPADYRRWLLPYIGVPVATTELLADSYKPSFTWNDVVQAPVMSGKSLPATPPATRLEMPCQILHAGSSCSPNFGRQCVKAFKAALGVYAPIQAVQLAVFRRDKLVAAPATTLLHALRVVLRSSTFLTSYSAGAWGVHCFTHTVLGLHSRWVLFLCGVVGGSSILIEPPTRRPEIALYVWHGRP